jgi:hypothetical protein
MIGENALFIHVHVHDLLNTLLIFDALDLMALVNNTQVERFARDQPRVSESKNEMRRAVSAR